jgi:uncharacterized RDD family membrane protein YckC
MVLASRTHRFVAQILDAFTAFLPFMVLGPIMLFVAGPDSAMAVILVMAGIVFAISYHLFCDALPGGQSVGKEVMGIAVVDEHTGQACSAGQSFVRNLLLTVLGLLDWIFIFGEKRRRLGDMAAGTLVVQMAAEPRPTYKYIPSLDR